MVGKIIHFGLVTSSLLLLSGCASFSGLRTPKYDGQPFEAQPEKIAAFEESGEITGEEKAFYIPEPLSDDIYAASLVYSENEPMLLEEGTYHIGQEIPSGRVTMIGEKEDPSHDFQGLRDPSAPPSPTDYNVGTLTIRDEEDKLYFENMFHPYYGVNIVQVDLLAGHTIDIYGSDPEIVVFFQEELPENPYVFDTRMEDYYAELEALEHEVVEVEEGAELPSREQEQPVAVSDDGRMVELKAGIYEVGEHFEAGTYEITQQSSPSYTQLYLFREGEEPRIFDISENLYAISLGWQDFTQELYFGEDFPSIELLPGDKIYLHYINRLQLTRVD